jgi:hypothetical protein
MTTLRRKRHTTTQKEIPRAKRGVTAPSSGSPPIGGSSPPADWATTLRDMPAASPTASKDATTEPEIRRASRPSSSAAVKARRDTATKPEAPFAKRSRKDSPLLIHGMMSEAPTVSLRLPKPDPAVARYSVIPQQGGARFPTLEQYSGLLPKGLDSYPTALAKGAIVRRLLLDPVHSLPLGAGLPRVLEDLIRKPPSASDWVPLVYLSALHAAAYDSVFARKGGLAAFLSWSFERDLKLFNTPPYKSLLAVDGPERLLANHGARWAAFHRGSSLQVMEAVKGKVALRLSYPRYSWGEPSRIALEAAFRAATVVAGATTSEVTSKEDSPQASTFHVHWR